MVFSFTPFVTQIGIQYWFLAGRAARRRLQLPAAGRMTRWLLIAGDFTPLGGMDRANHALAMHLARARTGDVHSRRAPGRGRISREQPSVVAIHVRRPLGSHLLGAPLLASAGERQARSCAARLMLIANGGNADAGDVTWVHYLHARA